MMLFVFIYTHIAYCGHSKHSVITYNEINNINEEMIRETNERIDQIISGLPDMSIIDSIIEDINCIIQYHTNICELQLVNNDTINMIIDIKNKLEIIIQIACVNICNMAANTINYINIFRHNSEERINNGGDISIEIDNVYQYAINARNITLPLINNAIRYMNIGIVSMLDSIVHSNDVIGNMIDRIKHIIEIHSH